MPRLGSVRAAPFVGSEFVSLYLGETRVPTVPGPPVITDAYLTPGVGYAEIYADAPTNTGGLPITGYKVYADGVWDSGAQLQFNASGMNANSVLSVGAGTITVSALNAIGEGPQSENAP
jgi:hypothetical protein